MNSNLVNPMRITRIQDPELGATYTLDYNVSDFRLIIIETNGTLPQYEIWCRQAVAVYGDAWYGTNGMRNDASIITENPNYYVLLRFEFVSPNQIRIVQKLMSTFTNCALRIYGIK